MARKRKTSDDVYNARRRLKRQAARLLKSAKDQGGIMASRLRKQAERLLDMAKRTYKGADTPSRQKKLVEESEQQLVSRRKGLDEKKNREAEAKEIMKTVAGRRIYAATTDIWEDSEYSDRDIPIIAFFGAQDMLEVIEIFEREFGQDLYKEPESEDYPSDSTTLKMILEVSRIKNTGRANAQG